MENMTVPEGIVAERPMQEVLRDASRRRRNTLHHRRERHRQGGRGRHRPPLERPRRRLHQGGYAIPERPWRELFGHERARSPARLPDGSAVSRKPTAAHCSSINRRDVARAQAKLCRSPTRPFQPHRREHRGPCQRAYPRRHQPRPERKSRKVGSANLFYRLNVMGNPAAPSRAPSNIVPLARRFADELSKGRRAFPGAIVCLEQYALAETCVNCAMPSNGRPPSPGRCPDQHLPKRVQLTPTNPNSRQPPGTVMNEVEHSTILRVLKEQPTTAAGRPRLGINNTLTYRLKQYRERGVSSDPGNMLPQAEHDARAKRNG